MLRSHLARASVDVAADLLGCTLTHETEAGTVTITVTEVEAYAGESDPASHAFKGQTARNAVMFGEAGHLYVYLSYGLHFCANVVTGREGEASAVLLRAGRVVTGEEVARQRRGERVKDRGLARGPACLTQALGIDLTHNGQDLLGGDSLRLEMGKPLTPADIDIATGPRVGVSLAQDVPWRLWVNDDETVSAYKRSPRAPDL